MKKSLAVATLLSPLFILNSTSASAASYSLTATCSFSVPASTVEPIVTPVADFEWRVNGGASTPASNQPSCALALAGVSINPGDTVEVRGREKNTCGNTCSSGNGTYTAWSSWVQATAPLPAGLDLGTAGAPTGWSISIIRQQ